MKNNIKILELMSARMFHDLAGPVGAVNNSLEFFEEENESIRAKALEIVKSSSNEAILRLKYFRQAYGPINEDEVALNEMLPVIQEFIEKGRLELKCPTDANIIVTGSIAKIILNFVVIAMGAMIYGGVLEIIPNGTGVKIKFIGKDLILNDETTALLSGDMNHISLSSANIQVYYLHMIISNAKHNLTINKAANEVEFIIK